VFLLAISFISPLAVLIGKLLTWLIYFLNWTVFTTEKLPFSLISDIHITTLQCWLLMGVLISFIFLFEFRSMKWLYAACLFTLLFSGFQWRHFRESVDKDQLVVYSISGHQAVEFIDRGKSYFFADSSLMNDEERVRFHIRPNRLQHGVAKVNQEIPFIKKIDGSTIFQWRGKSVATLSQRNSDLPLNLKVDYLIVSQNSFPLFNKRNRDYEIGQLIIDGSNSRSYTNKLTKFAKAENIPVHSVLEQGAFIIECRR
jgi:competence protein ComEC